MDTRLTPPNWPASSLDIHHDDCHPGHRADPLPWSWPLHSLPPFPVPGMCAVPNAQYQCPVPITISTPSIQYPVLGMHPVLGVQYQISSQHCYSVNGMCLVPRMSSICSVHPVPNFQYQVYMASTHCPVPGDQHLNLWPNNVCCSMGWQMEMEEGRNAHLVSWNAPYLNTLLKTRPLNNVAL